MHCSFKCSLSWVSYDWISYISNFWTKCYEVIANAKYPIFEKLTLENKLSFDNFLEEYEKVKPENNYDMFTSNSYEQKFKTNKSFEMEFELQI